MGELEDGSSGALQRIMALGLRARAGLRYKEQMDRVHCLESFAAYSQAHTDVAICCSEINSLPGTPPFRSSPEQSGHGGSKGLFLALAWLSLQSGDFGLEPCSRCGGLQQNRVGFPGPLSVLEPQNLELRAKARSLHRARRDLGAVLPPPLTLAEGVGEWGSLYSPKALSQAWLV